MDYGVLGGSVEETKQQKMENGKRRGEVRKCIPTYIGEKSYPAGRPLACVVVDVDV